MPVLTILERPDYVICTCIYLQFVLESETGSKANNFSILSSLPLYPPATMAMIGVSLLLTNTDRRYVLAYPYYWRGLVGAKMKTSVGLLVFNSSMTRSVPI